MNKLISYWPNVNWGFHNNQTLPAWCFEWFITYKHYVQRLREALIAWALSIFVSESPNSPTCWSCINKFISFYLVDPFRPLHYIIRCYLWGGKGFIPHPSLLCYPHYLDSHLEPVFVPSPSVSSLFLCINASYVFELFHFLFSAFLPLTTCQSLDYSSSMSTFLVCCSFHLVALFMDSPPFDDCS